ncbi:hypothetical protein [Mesobacillus jeotgali]|uniref:hypothetical protein n=1 Tax=Mesobacillus jeotgali TaxID=129985 RepID=UPI000C842862|nr:hypothetical protein [Mesobacillus jeotgali]
MKKGYIRVGHLVYIIIIAVIVLSFFLVIAFGGLESASTMMGTASTVSSLILSVIAIVLSLIDVTGQRQSMVDLKETSDQLQETNQTAIKLNKDLMEKMNQLQVMKDQMVEAISESTEWRKELIEKLEDVRQKGDFNKDDLNKVIDEAKKMNLRDSAGPLTITTYSAMRLLKDKFSSGDTVKHSELKDYLMDNLDMTNATFKNAYRYLIKRGYLIEYLSPTEEVSVQFTNHFDHL